MVAIEGLLLAIDLLTIIDYHGFDGQSLLQSLDLKAVVRLFLVGNIIISCWLLYIWHFFRGENLCFLRFTAPMVATGSP